MRLSAELVPLTVPEIRRLLAALGLRVTRPARTGQAKMAEHVLAWSHWRRRHQAIARRCHYARHLAHYAA